MAEFVRWLVDDRGAAVVFVPQVTYSDGGDDDRVASRRVAHAAGRPERFLVVENDMTAAQVKGLCGRMEFFVGTRMHSNIFALSEGVPTVLRVLTELRKVHSVEKIVMAKDTEERNPSHFKKVSEAFGEDVKVEVIPHDELKKRSHTVKTIIRTGDFTAWGNVMLVSGAGDRWQIENPKEGE